MRRLTSAVLWVYDFLAEDMVLLVGSIAAVVIAVIAIHTVKPAAGYILWAAVILIIAASLWRTAKAT